MSADLDLSQFEGMTARITEYLCVGGMWNPELMEHDKVRDLLVEMRAAVPSLIAEVKRLREERPRVEQCVECRVFVSDWVDTEESKGRICRPCETVRSLRAENERLTKACEKEFASVEHLNAKLLKLWADVEQLTHEKDKLSAFKAYVHKRLDDAGIPVDPESTHKAEGCRIGGRLDVVFARIEELERDREDLSWMDNNPGEIVFNNAYHGAMGGWSRAGYTDDFPSIRDAIKSARAAMQTNPER